MYWSQKEKSSQLTQKLGVIHSSATLELTQKVPPTYLIRCKAKIIHKFKRAPAVTWALLQLVYVFDQAIETNSTWHELFLSFRSQWICLLSSLMTLHNFFNEVNVANSWLPINNFSILRVVVFFNFFRLCLFISSNNFFM